MHHRRVLPIAPDEHAVRIYRLADSDPAAPPGIAILAERIGLPIVERPSMPIDARLERVGGGHVIAVRPSTTDAMLAWGIGQGIASWYALIAPGAADVCDDIAASLLLPSAALKLAISALGLSVAELAASFVAPFPIVERRLRRIGLMHRSGEYSRVVRRPA